MAAADMTKIILEDDVDCDELRRVYSDLTFEQVAEVNKCIDIMFPWQNQCHGIHFNRMLRDIPVDNMRIIELGCHQGQLAKRILNNNSNIQSWIGYDFEGPISRNLCQDNRYSAVVLTDWFHDTTIPDCDVFISSHTLEHMSGQQVEKTLNTCNADHILIEVPVIEDGITAWPSGTYTHVLHWSLRHFRDWMSSNNYRIFFEVPSPLGIIGASKEG